MAWTERQQALLGAMGLRVWSPPAGSADAGEAAEAAGFAAAVQPRPGPAGLDDEDDAPDVHDDDDTGDFRAPLAAPQPSRPGPRSAPQPAPPSAPRRPLVARSDIATLDWPQLRAAVAACTACGLCSSRTRTVFGAGHLQADWLVVGEAPGEQEDQQGEPFVGASGQLLDRMLAALQLTRSSEGSIENKTPPSRRVYIANTLKCRPPRNRNPSAEELAQCEPFLVRQIELLKPRIILAMGRFAVQTLLRSDEPLGKLRGRVHRYQGVPLVVTYHPAYLLRSLPEKAKAWEDLCLAADTAESADHA